jgi:hypothetical protein
MTFCWEDVGVWCSSPDNAALLKTLEIAEKLDARVIGEDETVFRIGPDGGLLEIAPKEGEGDEQNSAEKQPWWKKIFS